MVLLGFACDEGARRNKGRVGAAGAPLAMRKLLANTAWHLSRPVHDGGDLACEDGDLDAAHDRLAERVAARWIWGHFPWCWGRSRGGLSAAGRPQSPSGRQGAGSGSSTSMPLTCAMKRRSWQAQALPFFQIAGQLRRSGTTFHYACLGVAETANTKPCLPAAMNWACGMCWTRR